MKLDRLHLTLGVLLALGVAFRAIHERGPQATSASPTLERQINEVSSRRKGGKQKESLNARNRPKGGTRPLPAASGPALRIESTPIGALPPGQATRSGIGLALLVDLDVASATSIESLPRIGPALARRILEDRAKRGPFGSLEALDRVRGVGPALQREIAPYVTFSTSGRPSTVAAVPLSEAIAGRGKGRRRPPTSVVR